MNWRELPRFFTLAVAVLAGFGIQAHLVQEGHQEFVYGYVIGALIYQTLSDPKWFREIAGPEDFVSVLMWVLFPFVATFGTIWRMFNEK